MDSSRKFPTQNKTSVTTDMTLIKSVTAWKEVACICRANVCSMRYPTGWEEGYRLSLPGLTSCWIICLGNTWRKQTVAVLPLLHVHTSSAWADKLNSNWKMLSVTKCSLPSLSFTLTWWPFTALTWPEGINRDGCEGFSSLWTAFWQRLIVYDILWIVGSAKKEERKKCVFVGMFIFCVSS